MSQRRRAASLGMRSGAEGGRIDLHQAFLRVQEQTLANLNASRVYDHYATRLRRSSEPVLCAGSVLPPRSAFPILAGILCLGEPDAESLGPAVTGMLPYLDGEKLLDLGSWADVDLLSCYGDNFILRARLRETRDPSATGSRRNSRPPRRA